MGKIIIWAIQWKSCENLKVGRKAKLWKKFKQIVEHGYCVKVQPSKRTEAILFKLIEFYHMSKLSIMQKTVYDEK